MKYLMCLLILSVNLSGCATNSYYKNISDPTEGKGGFIDADGGDM